jgi:GT2 family glycosyltransferase
MMKKDLFDLSGGFHDGALTSGHDIDLCLRLIGMGKRNIFTPHARFLNHEADAENPLVSSTDCAVLAKTRSDIIGAVDRYYRPHDFGENEMNNRPRC